jgi:hypothetical protein
MFPEDQQPTHAEQLESYAPIELPPNLRIAFIHPDLGLGWSPHQIFSPLPFLLSPLDSSLTRMSFFV